MLEFYRMSDDWTSVTVICGVATMIFVLLFVSSASQLRDSVDKDNKDNKEVSKHLYALNLRAALAIAFACGVVIGIDGLFLGWACGMVAMWVGTHFYSDGEPTESLCDNKEIEVEVCSC